MLTSMTGFGRAQAEVSASGTRLQVEVHTLNHRFFELECRLPDGLHHFEDLIRKTVKQAVHRGRIKVTVSLVSENHKRSVIFRKDLACRYVRELKALRKAAGLSDPITLEMVLGLPQVVGTSDKEGAPQLTWNRLKKPVDQAIRQLNAMRDKEGRQLAAALLKEITEYQRIYRKVKARAPKVQQLQKRLAGRIRSVGGHLPAKSAAAEAAAIVQGSDVTEEIARIQSHLLTLHQAARGRGDNPGRTIDFLAQELNRESNTIGAKLRDGQVAQWVVAMKAQIEKIREQAANIE